MNSNHAQSNFIAKESGNYKVKYYYPATGIEYISNEIYVNVKTQVKKNAQGTKHTYL